LQPFLCWLQRLDLLWGRSVAWSKRTRTWDWSSNYIWCRG